MMGLVRLYVQPSEKLPAGHVPDDYAPVIDIVPEEANQRRRALRRQGYDVIAVPL